MVRHVHRAAAWLVSALLAAAALTAGVGTAQAEPPATKSAPQGTPIVVGGDKPAQQVRYRRSSGRPNNQAVGVLQTGFFCSGGQEVRFTDQLAQLIMRLMPPIARAEIDAAGYPKIEQSAFADQQTNSNVEYDLAATLVDMQMNFCGSGSEYTGGTWLQIDFELFSPRERKVVYRATHAGSVRAEKSMSGTAMYQQALRAAVRNLLADPAFVEHATRRAVSGGGAGLASLTLPARAAATGTAQERMPAIQSGVATIYASAGSGSGFYIDAQGYLLTNQHVVGDSKFVKVKLANGRELLGEVLRSDSGRDVALVKTEAVALAPLDLATEEPKVGEEVYAIGSPFGEQLATSVTRGVLSGMREVEQKRWLQSDVRILPGSSGGPLVASNGTVVGISTRALAGGLAGINLFVPIREATSVLRIEFAAR